MVFDEDLNPVEPGSGVIGKIARSGDIPMGYYNDPKKTAEVFITVRGTRYVMPGDFATVEADGSITLLGRGSIVINSGGDSRGPSLRFTGRRRTHASFHSQRRPSTSLNASGWPHAVVAMGITVLVIFLLDPTIPRRQLHGGWFAVLAGCLASVPVWLPLLAFSAMGTRVSYFSDLEDLFAPPLQSLLNPGFPSQVFMLSGLNGWERSSIPILFAGIPVLIVPALVRMDWWRSHLRELACWLCVAAIFLVLTMGPSQMGPLRWSFRFLPYFHLALCVLTAMLVSHAQFDRSRAAIWRTLAVCAAGFFIAWQATTSELETHVLSLVLLVVCTLTVWRLLAHPRAATIALIAMTLHHLGVRVGLFPT